MSESHKSKSEMRTLVTDDFRAAHERIFGERKPNRGRWVWDAKHGALVPESEYVPEHEDGRVPVLTDLYMDGTRSPVDGSDIGTRSKRREHMRRHNLADYDDYKQHNAKAAEKRAAYLRDGKSNPTALRETVGRALYESRKKR